MKNILPTILLLSAVILVLTSACQEDTKQHTTTMFQLEHKIEQFKTKSKQLTQQKRQRQMQHYLRSKN